VQSPGRRLAVIGLAAALVAVALAGCGGSTGPRILGRGPTSAVDGYAPLSVPLSPRRDAVVVAAGKYIFVYGGTHSDANDQFQMLRDGAEYDLVTGEWTALPHPPFDRPLYSPNGVWSGNELIVAGTQCEPHEALQEPSECGTEGISVAAYSPTMRTWRSLDIADDLSYETYDGGYPNVAPSYGTVNGRVVFVARTSFDQPPELLMFDPRTGTRQRFKIPNAGIDRICVTGAKLVAVHVGDTSPGPMFTFELDPATLQWTRLPDTPRASTAPELFSGESYCSAGQILYFPILQPPVGLDAGALWYLANQQRWTELPRFGPIGYAHFSAAERNGTRALWSASSEDLYLLPPGAVDWVRTKHPVSGRARFSVLDDAILVDTSPDSVAPITLALFDPSRFVTSGG
jgi:hypothetical protein